MGAEHAPAHAADAASSAASAQAIAAALMAADAAALEPLWLRADALPAPELAWAFKDVCERVWTSDPACTRRAADLADAWVQRRPQAEAMAVAAWTRAIAWLSQGQAEPALGALDAAGAGLAALGLAQPAAQTEVARVMALALLGRYEEAVACGERTRAAFDAFGDARAAGKLALNLGNLAAHRDHHAAAAGHYSDAAVRLAACGEVELELAAVTGLADLAARRHDFERAQSLYDQARAKAEAGGLALLLASIDGDLGALEMRRGRYARALSQLERSRRAYEALDLPHLLAVAEQSLADAYLELNLLPEALALVERSLATFVAAGLATDRAWALAQRGRVLGLLGRDARQSLRDAEQAFAAEGNPIGAALVQVWQAELALRRKDWTAAALAARAAEGPLRAASHHGWTLHAQTLLAEALLGAGDAARAQSVAHAASQAADTLDLPAAQRRAWRVLGLLARERGDAATARRCFERLVASIESQRGTLPSEEFRSAFLGDNLLPYVELARASLASGGPAGEALLWVERARARSLAEAMDDPGADDAPADERSRARLRLALDDCYRRLGRPDEADVPGLLEQARHIEAALLEQGRRSAIDGAADPSGGPSGGPSGDRSGGTGAAFDVDALQLALGDGRALVEYFAIDDTLYAFVVAGGELSALRLPVGLGEVFRRVEQFRFQIDTLRHGADRLARRMPELQQRVLAHLQHLHATLWAPLAARVGGRDAVVVPHAALHYLPFGALHDGACHEIERREFCHAPSAAVLLRCGGRRLRAPRRAWVLGHADARLPGVRREVDAVAAGFAGARVVHGASAATLRLAGADADLLHVACHAQFRNDSPRFSALHLADGAFTARDAARLRLDAALVTLSGCETGVSAVMPGDELIGLTHSFIAAGAARVIASLWTVQDAIAADFMRELYAQLGAGTHPALALRRAQLAAMHSHPHPYFWAAFVLHGGW